MTDNSIFQGLLDAILERIREQLKQIQQHTSAVGRLRCRSLGVVGGLELFSGCMSLHLTSIKKQRRTQTCDLENYCPGHISHNEYGT